jgi:nitroreductase
MRYNLSEITDLIRNRRTVLPERYSARKVHREQIELILNNALWAPTHGMTQPWRFKVYMDDGLQRLQSFMPEMYKRTTTAEKFNQTKYDRLLQRLQKTTVAIALCMERDASGKIAEIEEVEAVACAAQNMMLTCAAYGLGSFWSTPKFLSHEDSLAFFGLGPADKCLGIFYIGYPEGEWPVSHRKPLEYVTEWITSAT